uniref:Uncharacterized protein n=1 Tax=Ditylum brightwellii TaxID=49249 RepID=A0A7S2EUF5_9STRA|mmetsp:Transcript_7654/g.11413  ORF Transcript_7654/g.11413 Transcript_7654/m.11413 type:complete len:478 (+) Transcript_7654:69-1502(+)
MTSITNEPTLQDERDSFHDKENVKQSFTSNSEKPKGKSEKELMETSLKTEDVEEILNMLRKIIQHQKEDKNGGKEEDDAQLLQPRVVGRDRVTVPVQNYFYLKHIVGDEDDLVLVGSIIQCVFHRDISGLQNNDGLFDFGYRLNEVAAYDDVLVMRKEVSEKGAKTLFQMRAPLNLDVYFHSFIFKVLTATLTVELSTSHTSSKTFLPDLLLAKKDLRHNASIRIDTNPLPGIVIEDLKRSMDKMAKYDFITPFPTVEYFYDAKRGNCSKCKLTFYLRDVKDYSGSKIIEVLAPMLLISTLNTAHVFNPENNGDTSVTEYISNAATIALASVFLLEYLSVETTQILTETTLYLLMIFVGLALSSLPEALVGTRGVAIAGAVLVWLSLCIPMKAAIMFYLLQNKILRARKYQQFVMDSSVNDEKHDYSFKAFNHEKQDYNDYFQSCEDMLAAGELSRLYGQNQKPIRKRVHVIHYPKD